jgi:hypothetical protein
MSFPLPHPLSPFSLPVPFYSPVFVGCYPPHPSSPLVSTHVLFCHNHSLSLSLIIISVWLVHDQRRPYEPIRIDGSLALDSAY